MENNDQTLLIETKGLTLKQAIALKIKYVKDKNEIAPNAEGHARIVSTNKLEDSREHKLITDGDRSQK